APAHAVVARLAGGSPPWRRTARAVPAGPRDRVPAEPPLAAPSALSPCSRAPTLKPSRCPASGRIGHGAAGQLVSPGDSERAAPRADPQLLPISPRRSVPSAKQWDGCGGGPCVAAA